MIKNPTLVPPGSFAYMEPATGVTRNGQSLSATITLVQEHRVSNGLPRQQVDEVAEDVELQVCQRSPNDYCYGNLSVVQAQDIGRAQIISGIKAAGQWITAWLTGEDPFVDQAEAERRAAICARCFLNGGKRGCSGCGFADRLRDAVGLTIGDRVTVRDGVLQACLVCGCWNRVHIWFKAEILRETMTEEMRVKFASVSHCWKGKL